MGTYVPKDPVIENFGQVIGDGLQKASKYGKYMGSISKGKPLTVKIPDDEMSPVFKKGDVITVKHVHMDKFKIGDFIFYRGGYNMVVRRVIQKIVKVGQTELITKAENSKTPSKPVKPSQVIGKVIKIVRNNKEVSIPYMVSIFDKITAFGTIPLHKVILTGIAALIPFYHPYDEMIDSRGKVTSKEK